MKKLFPLLVLLLVTVGCEGPEGPTGAKGKDGADGNANVAAIPAGYVDPASWVYSSTAGLYYYDVVVNAITADIINNGSVLVYYSTNGADWLLTPFTSRLNADEFYIVDAIHLVGKVQIRYRHSDPNKTVYPSSRVYFKIVIIASGLGKYSTGINWNDYNEVKQNFNLQD